ncbi:MAG: DUF6768 family protein [Pseudomonadota bacterium]
MNEIDDKILAAIRTETEESLDDYKEELGLFGLVNESFKGKLRWVVFTAFALILAFIALGVYCAFNFVHATDIGVKLNWFGGSALAFLIVIVLRLWYFMELNRLSIRREVKRVELQVSLLGAMIEKTLEKQS